MPTSFPITAASNVITLDATRKGTASLTLTNAAGRPVRARLTAVATGEAQASWVTVQGGAERDLPLGSAQEITVVVNVPATVAAGDYVFRIDVVAEDKPEDEFARGPDLTVKVPVTGPIEVPWWRKWWWLVAAVVGVVVVGSAIVFGFSHGGGSTTTTTPTTATTTVPKVVVPGVIGTPLGQAVSALTTAKLTTAFVVVPGLPASCAQDVIATNPAAGTFVASGSQVVLAVPPRPLVVGLCIKEVIGSQQISSASLHSLFPTMSATTTTGP